MAQRETGRVVLDGCLVGAVLALQIPEPQVHLREIRLELGGIGTFLHQLRENRARRLEIFPRDLQILHGLFVGAFLLGRLLSSILVAARRIRHLLLRIHRFLNAVEQRRAVQVVKGRHGFVERRSHIIITILRGCRKQQGLLGGHDALFNRGQGRFEISLVQQRLGHGVVLRSFGTVVRGERRSGGCLEAADAAAAALGAEQQRAVVRKPQPQRRFHLDTAEGSAFPPAGAPPSTEFWLVGEGLEGVAAMVPKDEY